MCRRDLAPDLETGIKSTQHFAMDTDKNKIMIACFFGVTRELLFQFQIVLGNDLTGTPTK